MKKGYFVFIIIFLLFLICSKKISIFSEERNNDDNIILQEIRQKVQDTTIYSTKYDEYEKLTFIGAKEKGHALTIEKLDLKGRSHKFDYDEQGNLVKITTYPDCNCPYFYITILEYDDNKKLSTSVTFCYLEEEIEEKLKSKKIIRFEYNDKNELIDKKIEYIYP